ncbi:MAG: glutaredoxin domain-containing protein [Candidatus Sericytochromatia bacterium]|nr:glutaredoxin domain-containing protein [Candidatus Sericytochromatia bacterium]
MNEMPLVGLTAQSTGAQPERDVAAIREEIAAEIAAHKILVYGKGTKEHPLCGFTVETKEFFEKYGHPFEIVNVLHDTDKRQVLTEMTDWRTLPKVFIDGQFYGDTDILGPMEQKGELQTLLAKVFA